MVTAEPCNLLEYEWTSHKNKDVELAQPVKINIEQSNSYWKNFSRLPYNDEQRVQET